MPVEGFGRSRPQMVVKNVPWLKKVKEPKEKDETEEEDEG
jgi:hypothetical protein